MSDHDLENIIIQIMWGRSFVKVEDESGVEHTFIIRPPDIQERNFAEHWHQCELDQAKKDGLLTEEEILSLAISIGEWSKYDQDILDKYDDMVEYAEKEREQAQFVSQRKGIDKQLERLAKKREDADSRRLALTNNSVETRARERQIVYILSCVTLDMDGQLVFPDGVAGCTDQTLLWNLVKAYLNLRFDVDIKLIRRIARSNFWRAKWAAAREKPTHELFGCSVRDLSDVQFLLMHWSQIYDNVYQSMDCPSESIIKDDESLDKWLKEQSEKHEAEKEQRAFESKGDKKRGFFDRNGKFHQHGRSVTDHHEVGVCVSGEFDHKTGVWKPYTQEEKQQRINQIYGRNSQRARSVLAHEADKIDAKGVMREEQLRNRRTMMLLGGKVNTQAPRRTR